MANIKLKDGTGAEQVYNGVSRIRVPDENGNKIDFVKIGGRVTINATIGGSTRLTVYGVCNEPDAKFEPLLIDTASASIDNVHYLEIIKSASIGQLFITSNNNGNNFVEVSRQISGAPENYRESIKGLVFGDVTLTVTVSCFLPDTQITLADGTTKAIKDLTYDDQLRVWDFDKGEFSTSSICWLVRSGCYNDHYYKLTFSDGTVLCTTGQNSNHKVYNVDERYFKGVDKTKVGDRIFSERGILTVTNVEYIEEDVEYYNLITTGTINCFAEGILTSDRYGNLYPIDDEMKYIKGDTPIRPYSEFEAVGIKRYWYDTLRLGEVSGTIEQTRDYISKLECQMLTPPNMY